jgi:hypothetical protein
MAATNVYVTLIKEVMNRLNTAKASGKLTDVVEIILGGKKDAKENIDKPAIAVVTDDEFIVENYSGHGHQNYKSAFVKLKIIILDKLDDGRESNLYYTDATPPAGILPLIEKVLDVLSETTGQSLDPQMASNSRKSIGLSVGAINKLSDNSMRCDITMTMNIEDFLINGRYSN